MNIAGLPDLVASLFRGPSTATQAQTPAPQTAPSFQPGAEYTGIVQQRLPNGRLVVDVAGQRMNMALPGEFKAGDSVRLTYVTNASRPTFVLRQDPVQPAQTVQISGSAQQATALVRLAAVVTGQAAPAAMASSERPIATSASMLAGPAGSALPGVGPGRASGLLGEAVDATRAAISSSSTLTANTATQLPAPSREMLPARLAQTLSESGLFYESHLAQWTRGERSLDAIQREPQAHLANQPAAPDLGMPVKAAQIASQQMHLLEGQPFVWQGQAWPGQTVEWRVEEGEEREGNGKEDEAHAWNTDLTMTLPRLGHVEARLGLSGDQLSLGLRADDAPTRAAMQAALPELVAALQAAGLEPVRIAITGGDEARDG